MEQSNEKEHNISALDAIKAQRAALKNFYHLKKGEEGNSTQKAQQEGKPEPLHKNSSTFSIDSIDPSSIEDVDEFIATQSYLNILKTENKVLDKLNTAKSEIKSIIYNNYYELIKINNVLEELLRPNNPQVYSNTIEDNLNTIRENMDKIKSLDIDIFDDLTGRDVDKGVNESLEGQTKVNK